MRYSSQLALRTAAVMVAMIWAGGSATAATNYVPHGGGGSKGGKRFGVVLGVLDPFPSFVSFNLAMNATPNIRLMAGGGTFFFGSTIAASARWIVYPMSQISPMVGISYGKTTISDPLKGFLGARPSPVQSVSISAVSFGLDWRGASGLNLTAGGNWMWHSSPRAVMGWDFMPFLNLGWFF